MPTDSTSTVRSAALETLAIPALYGFAVAQPMLALLGNQVGYFTANQYNAAAIGAFAIIIGLLFPLTLMAITFAGRLVKEKFFTGLLSLIMGALWVLIALPFLKPMPGGVALIVALALAVGLVWLTWKKPGFQGFLRFAALALPCFVLLFVFASKATPLIFEKQSSYAPIVQADTSKAYPPVVVVFWDELPINTLLDTEGKIDRERYPHFAEFADHATWYANTNSVGGSTIWAIPAMLTGQIPEHSELHTPRQRQTNLFTLLGQTHSFANVSEKHTTLCPPTLCKHGKCRPFKKVMGSMDDLTIIYLHLIAPRDWEANLPDVSNNWGNFAKAAPVGSKPNPPDKPQSVAERRAERDRKNQEMAVPNHKRNLFLRFLKRIEPYEAGQGKPPFYFMHIVFPHVPYNYMASGKYYSIAAYRYFTTWKDQRETYYDYQRHMLQVGATDELMGQLITRLKEQGLYDNAVIVIAADHGVDWGAVGTERRKLQAQNHVNVMRVPLFIHTPGQKKSRVDRREILTRDILPTIADMLKLPLQGKVDGQSLLSPNYVPAKQVRIIDNVGKDWWTFPVASHAEKAALLHRKAAWFGTGKPQKVFTTAPFFHPLIGRKIGTVQASDWQYELAAPQNYDAVDLASDFTPAQIEGWISPDASGRYPQDMAVAVNDVIRATYPYFKPEEKRLRFETMVPEESFVAGSNAIRLFAIEAGGQLREIKRR